MESEDKKRLVKVGQKHAAFVLSSLSIWGATDYWAAESGIVLALGLALINSIVAGTIIASILHEWGHFRGPTMAQYSFGKTFLSFSLFQTRATAGQFLR